MASPETDLPVKNEQQSPLAADGDATPQSQATPKSDVKPRSRKDESAVDASKRRCVSTACIACRKRKSKCDGNVPACAACSSVYGTECVYDPNSDHRRKGVYKKDIDSLKTRNSTLQTLIQALLNTPEDEVLELVRQIRTCESLDKVAERIVAKEKARPAAAEDTDEDIPVARDDSQSPTFESHLSSKMGTLQLESGAVRYIGGTSNLHLLNSEEAISSHDDFDMADHPTTSWTNVTDDIELINHLLNQYFSWHYTFFTILPKSSFYRDFLAGKPPHNSRRKQEYCSSVLVNAMLALGCHFTAHPGARADPDDSSTAGEHFSREAKRLLFEEDEYSKPSLANVQALALMSVREAGCAREPQGWGYSGMAFRMSCDLGLPFQTGSMLTTGSQHSPDEEEEDARKVTFWGCFQIDKCWSNYLGRLPQFQLSANVTIPRYDVFPTEEADTWTPYTDSGFNTAYSQPSRIRTVALQISVLCEISSDLIMHFYSPQIQDKQQGKQSEMKRLSEIHGRLEEWRRNLPKELEPKEGILPSVIVMHMFFQLLYIHLFRYFLKYNQSTSPLPAHVSPRKICTQAAGMISKLMRLYKRSHGLRQIVNFAVYIVHSACTIHLLNLPEKTAKRDIIHGVKHLEEIAEGWIAARRTLRHISIQVKNWKVELPEEAAAVLARTDTKFGPQDFGKSPASLDLDRSSPPDAQVRQQNQAQQHQSQPQQNSHLNAWQQQPDSYEWDESMLVDDFQSHGDLQSSRNMYLLPTPNIGQHQFSSLLPYGNTLGQQSGTISGFGSSQASTPLSQTQSPTIQQLSTQQQAVPPHQPQRTSANPSLMQKSLKRSFQPAGASDPFGGVEALLREGQGWFMKDHSTDLAAGFGNWDSAKQQHTQQPTAATSSASSIQQSYGIEVNPANSWIQPNQAAIQKPRAKPQANAGWTAKSGNYSGGVDGHRRGSVVGGGSHTGEDEAVLLGGNPRGLGSTSGYVANGAQTAPGSGSAVPGFNYGVLTDAYNEEDWYQ